MGSPGLPLALRVKGCMTMTTMMIPAGGMVRAQGSSSPAFPCLSAAENAVSLMQKATSCFIPCSSSTNLTATSSLWKHSSSLISPSFPCPLLQGFSLLLHDHTGHDLLCTLAVFGSSFAWIRLFDFLVQRNILGQKLSRKLVHISTGILYALLWPVFSISPRSRYFALAIPFANAVRLLVYGLGIMKDDDVVKSISRSGSSRELLSGPFYYVMVLSMCTVFFWRDSPVGMVALAIMCGGDGIADIVGRRLGSVKLPYNSSKSWVGSIAMFSFSFALSVCFLYYYSALGFYQLNWSNALQMVALISFVATIVESLPISTHLDDNISVPLISVLMGSALFPGVLL